METLLLGIIISLKFLIPSYMLINPLVGLWGNYILDVIDGDILLSLGMIDETYQSLDKFADLIAYVFMFILARRWRIRKTVTVLFFYRLIGQLGFFIAGDERIFFLFQNFLEPLMLIYVLIILKQKSEEKAYAVYRKYIWLWWGIILAYKIWEEWRIHVANFDLSLFLFGVTGGM
jgi:hypothetical protein